MVAIPLDASIRTWQFIPVVVLTLLATLLRQGLSSLMQRGKGGMSPMPTGQSTLSEVHTGNVVAVSQLTRMAASGLAPGSLLARKRYYLGKDENGKLCNPPEAGPNPLQAMMNQDPSAMAGMMKYNMAFLILNGGLAYLISYLFSEAIVGKTPFALTQTFKSILQRGIDVQDLDVSYISALSLYFLTLFCSGSLTFLINKAIGTLANPSTSLADIDPMMMGMAMGGGGSNPMGGGNDPAKAFGQEADNWKILTQRDFLPDAEQLALKALNQH